MIRIRDFIYDLTNTALSFVRIILLNRFFLKQIEKKPDTESLVILGNGPSLKTFLTSHRSFCEGKATLCVNFFARTKEYADIKPDYYLIISPEFFVKEQKKEWAEDRMEILRAIARYTNWPMQLILPAIAKGNKDWQAIFEKNKFIKIRYVNNTPLEGWDRLIFPLFLRNFGMPRPHNVLIPAILNGIRLEFEKVFLVGADHSWIPNIVVDTKNNVLITQKHFYDDQTVNEKIDKNKPVPAPMYKGASLQKRKLHEVLEKFYFSFRSYWTLRRFAEKNHVKIINLTINSFIDAFPKKNIDEL